MLHIYVVLQIFCLKNREQIRLKTKIDFSWFPEEKISEYPLAIGEDISLVIGMQLLNNARVVFMSSLSFLSSKIQTQKHIVTWNDETGKTDRVMSSNEKFLTRVSFY